MQLQVCRSLSYVWIMFKISHHLQSDSQQRSRIQILHRGYGANFQKRYPKHKDALLKKESKESTSLSTYVWSLRDLNQDPTIKWEVIRPCMPYTCGSRRCDNCLSEKLCILESDENCINKNTELMQKCRHSNKFKLKNIGKRKNV